MLAYASERTGRAKSEIFRVALLEYYNKVCLTELNLENSEDETWDLGTINLKRVIRCPFCQSQIRVNLEDECQVTTNDRQMGVETLYEFDFEDNCPSCQKTYNVAGYVSEYPSGALNFEKINVTLVEPRADIPVSDLPKQVVDLGKATIEIMIRQKQNKKTLNGGTANE